MIKLESSEASLIKNEINNFQLRIQIEDLTSILILDKIIDKLNLELFCQIKHKSQLIVNNNSRLSPNQYLRGDNKKPPQSPRSRLGRLRYSKSS